MATQIVIGEGLCEVCQRISLKSLLAAEGFEHISDYRVLAASGEKCRMCSLIYDSIDRVFSQISSRRWYTGNTSDSSRFTVLRGLERENFVLDHILVCCGFAANTFEHREEPSIIPPGTFLVGRLDISAEKQDPAAKFVKNRIIPREPGSEASMFMATQLLNECLSMHPLCRVPQTTSLPTRVLDVGTIVDDTICLLISGGRKAGYAALSYCWGGQQEVVASEGSYEGMAQGIPLSNLPKTIQDAVTVTRRLGLKYLWVDALCIMQDSPEDWALESSKIGDIYGNATITIAAAGGSTCHAGCFIQNSRNTAHSLDKMSLRLPDFGTISLCVQNDYNPMNDPLNQRAWALQERLLSPRLLIYSVGKLSWQCQTKAAPAGIGSARLPDLFFEEMPVRLHRVWPWNTTPHNSISTLESLWVKISLDYSLRAITYAHDRLPALSGLARRFRDITDDVYLAGLWKETLCLGLMWQATYVLKSRPSTYVAPTWSWLSIQGPIIYANYPRTGKDRPLFEVLKAETVPEGSDTMGAVLSGNITLRGQVKQARQKANRELWGVAEEQVGHALVDFESEFVDSIDGPLWCLQLFEDKGLLLKPSGESYQRVGIFVLGWEEFGGITGQTWFEDSELRTLNLI